uniref:Cysteine-rich venom protein ophanin-like n=1 Tax=Takifugu rubripes TaxID=31033 RepID=A0A3B5K6P7_TAKRU
MLLFLMCFLSLQQASAACVLTGICTDNTSVQAEIVDMHNSLRRAVQPAASDMLKMSYDGAVAASAQAWVSKCLLKHGPPTSRVINGYEMGENLFYSSSPFSWTTVISSWHSEAANFLYPNVSVNGASTGHYTQIVWNSSYKVGCGVAVCPNNIYFYGCHYYRAGNYKGWNPYQKGPSCASCPNNCEDKLCTNPCPVVNDFLNCGALKALFGCNNRWVPSWCPASCQCSDKIIPIA